MSREALDALEAWHTTTQALRDATPWTSEWVRLRMIAQEQRAAYEALIEGGPNANLDVEDGSDVASGAPTGESAGLTASD